MTNSTMLLLSRLYYFSQAKFESMINQIFDEQKIEIDVGFRFEQQTLSPESIPDALLKQAGVEIVVEAKLGNEFDSDQLIRHLSAFSRGTHKRVLLALGKGKVHRDIENTIKDALESKGLLNMFFVSTTYSELYKSVQSVLSSFDEEMNQINGDYYELCAAEGLIDDHADRMIVVTAGTSLRENLQYAIYYDPADRTNSLGFKYLGLYVNKSVCAVGVVEKVVECDLIDDEVKIQDGQTLTPIEMERVRAIIKNTDYYDIKSGHKFYLVDDFVNTSFNKTSYGPLRWKRYFDLNDLPGYQKDLAIHGIADLLNQSTWE